MTEVTEFNSTYNSTDGGEQSAGAISWDDATWILACSFIIFTMQSGNFNISPNMQLIDFN